MARWLLFLYGQTDGEHEAEGIKWILNYSQKI